MVIVFSGLVLCGMGSSPSTSKASSKLYSGTHSYPETQAEKVDILKAFPSETNEKIGEVELDSPYYMTSKSLRGTDIETQAVFEARLKQKVAEMGGDAVVIQEDGFSEQELKPSGNELILEHSGRKVRGVVIKYALS